MRLAVLASVILLCTAPMAAAQKISPEPSAPPAPTIRLTPTPESLAGARDMANFLLIESEVMGPALQVAFDAMLPELRRSLLTGPLYDSLRPSSQRAMHAFVDSMPRMVEEELNAEMPVIAENLSQDLATLFTSQEMIDINAFLRQPRVRDIYLRSVTAGARGAATGQNETVTALGALNGLTPEELAIFAAFEATPSGQAMIAKNDQFTAYLEHHFERGSQALMPRLQLRIVQGMCAALENNCPPQLRETGQPA